MASFHEIFGDSDPDESFERFRDSGINDSAVTSTVEEDDDEDDISVKSLSSDEEESEESMDESSSDESNNVVARLTLICETKRTHLQPLYRQGACRTKISIYCYFAKPKLAYITILRNQN